MNELKDKVKIPSWVSCRTYFFGEEKSRTYIANEKKHTYVQLDGLASDMWKMLYDKIDGESFEKWAEKNGVKEEVDPFVNELLNQGLLYLEGSAGFSEETYGKMAEETDPTEESKFVEEMQSWLFGHGFMFSLFFELTYRCDLKCVHCYNPKHMSNIELDFDLCKKAIDDAYDVGCFRVTFSGGESTLHSKFVELVKYARSKHMSVEIFTNGQMLYKNKDLYDEIINQYVYRVCVSLYSTEEKMHEQVTDVKGSFYNTFSLINKLRADNVNVQIKNFLLNFNCMDCIKVKSFAEEIKATSVADISLIPTIEGDKKTMQYKLDKEDLFKLYIDEKSPLYVGKNIVKRDYEKIKDSSPCLAGFTGLCVSPTGEVGICVSMPYIIGSLNKTSLKDMWQGAIDKEEDNKLYKWQKVTIKDLKKCYKEEYCDFCSYCPGMGYLENGYLEPSTVLCEQAKTKMKAYNYLKEKEKNKDI